MKNILCCDCQYCGDKYSFPLPNDLIEVDSENLLLNIITVAVGTQNFTEKISQI